MKVLVAIPCLLEGGTEVQTLSLVEALSEAGHHVGVVCYFEWSGKMAEAFRKSGAEVTLLSPDGKRPTGIVATTRFLWKGLGETVRSFRPDVVHVQYMAPGALPTLILRLRGVKQILATLHTGADIFSPRGLKIIRFLTSRILTGMQCISLTAEKSFFGKAVLFENNSSGQSPSSFLPKHFTIYNAVPSHISPLTGTRTRLDNSPLTVGVVSRLEPIKGMDLVVPAFIKARSADIDLRLIVAGAGSLRKEMERQVAEAGVEEYVEFAGLIESVELERIYDRIDVLLVPSRSEGFGLTLIEGMTRGCVPVAANVGGLPEVMGPVLAPLLHAPESVDDIAARIMLLARDRNLLAYYSAAALSRAIEFAPHKYRQAVQQLYRLLETNDGNMS
ncbi:MAG: glycosyltransferase family 4 protein [Muribaculaceae bacterium]|nr:glycosyltransferase family 4 protein [Muribaculaceae bacterium]